ncbi:LacI family DNA-binding transcriptional regulator [Rhizobium paknamense]|uniref:LacI family transcriptional regulator n=1 Tax=Rhizobium paknamense TaxID=1206817 RepID=A0ABU0I8L3_9HYPH|nr:LacI family DNA-binding transcriptional regulator [Rhizobium paknamense]MDQ0454573.1 LacI family transcriptional regulator [Rhizobium paknamense]
MRGPTIQDLAKAANVSVATVDRILNGRARVREETVRKVQEAAHRLGFYGANAIRQRALSDRPELHFGIVLQKERHHFYQSFASLLQEKAKALTNRRVRLTLRFAQSTVPRDLADLLASMAGHVHAVAATGLDHPHVTAAVADLKERGIPTFSLLSDFAQGVRESYIGANNLKVGRTAGWLTASIARTPGKIGVFIGGHRFHGHELRETGFRSYLREYAPEFELLNPQANLETRQLTYEATCDLLEKHQDLVALYVAGGGMEGAIAAMREMRKPGEVVLLVNELTPESRQALLDRLVSIVMATPLSELCDELLAMMIHSAEQGMAETPGQRFLPIQLLTPESI